LLLKEKIYLEEKKSALKRDLIGFGFCLI